MGVAPLASQARVAGRMWKLVNHSLCAAFWLLGGQLRCANACAISSCLFVNLKIGVPPMQDFSQ